MSKRININTPEVWDSTGFPMNQGVVEPEGRRIHLTGQVAWDAGFNVHCIDDAAGQTRYALENIRKVLAEVGGTLDDVVSLTTYYIRPGDKEAITGARKEVLKKDFGPAATGVQVAGLWAEELLVELTVVAVVPLERFKTPERN